MIARAVSAATEGDATKIAPAIVFVGRTMAEDAFAASRSAIAAARQRLGARR